MNHYFYYRPNMMLHGIPNSIMEKARGVFWHSMGSWLDGIEFRAMTVVETAMRFPVPMSEGGGRRVQQMNYEHFISTMAAMMVKYAPEFLS